MKIAVMLMNGYEESEAFTIVDIIRRGQVECNLVGFENEVEGAHGIVARVDEILELENDYDMLVLPGGWTAVENMSKSDLLKQILLKMNEQHRYMGAICAAPTLLDKLGILKDKKYTVYFGLEEKMTSGHYVDQQVVVDDHIITAHAPACSYAFAYKLLELCHKDVESLKQRMVYYNSFKGENKHE